MNAASRAPYLAAGGLTASCALRTSRTERKRQRAPTSPECELSLPVCADMAAPDERRALASVAGGPANSHEAAPALRVAGLLQAGENSSGAGKSAPVVAPRRVKLRTSTSGA
jgi:hypothetical protein